MRLFIVVIVALVLASCGGGGGDSSVERRPVVLPSLPLQTAALARQAPIVDLDGTLHVGAPVAPPRASLAPGRQGRGVSGSAGYLTDGLGRAELLAYLRHDASEVAQQHYPDGYLARFGSTPPIVRVAEGTSPELVNVAVHAVQLINASLPASWQLRFGGIPGAAGADRIIEGEILIEFAPNADWPDRIRTPGSCLHGAGCASVDWAGAPPLRTGGGQVWIDPAQLPGIHLQSATVHELLHVLGRRHTDPERFTSVMASSQLPGHMLFPIDREVLLATYGWIMEGLVQPDDLASTFGPWAATSYHIRGDIDAVDGAAFGVAWRNRLSQPWATGPTPWTNLANNRELSGMVSWAGALIGFDHHTGHHVGSAADLEIDLLTLAGGLDFTDMRSWTAGDQVGVVPGATWGDGDLAYSVRVRGNTFVQTGGDAGIVTGIFVGARHEGMAGTLRRDDLAAAFGGSR